VKHGISIGAALIAMSIVAAAAPAAPAAAAPTGLGDQQQKREKTHRSNWEQIIRHKVMGVISMVEGGIAEAGARQAKMKAAMAAKAQMAAKAKQEAAMAAKAKQEAAMATKTQQGAVERP
jgi:hypothetical protein